MNSPERIYLRAQGPHIEDATWRMDKGPDDDVEYIRAELVKQYMQMVLDHEGVFFLADDAPPVLLDLANELVRAGTVHDHFASVMKHQVVPGLIEEAAKALGISPENSPEAAEEKASGPSGI